MMGSLRAGMSGMQAHLVKMNTLGSNIANVNTHGYKSQSTSFAEALVARLSGGSRPTAGRGGSNPLQVGLGVRVASVDTDFSAGPVEMTGVDTHLALQGDGFFQVRDGGRLGYTRAGNFSFDASGRMVAPGGLLVQGVMANNGVIPPGAPLGDITIPNNLQTPAEATTAGSVFGNLNSNAAPGDTATTYLTVNDSLGNEHSVLMTFTKGAAPNDWTWQAEYPVGTPVGGGDATFSATGQLLTFDDGLGGPPMVNFTPAGANPVAVTLSGSVGSGLTQFAGDGALVARADDGYGAGELDSINIDATGAIVGTFTNGTRMTLAQVGMTQFANPNGLERGSGGIWYAGVNSGQPENMVAGLGNATAIISGALEGSNVDLTEQFTDLIVTQRGYQSSARIITVSDEMLQEAVNLKR